MDDLKFHINSVDVDDAVSEGLWGEIYVEINGIHFPDNQWHDVVSSLLEMWLVEAINYIQKEGKQGCLSFMDGPYVINFWESNETDISISFVFDDSTVLKNANVRKSTFFLELLKCAHKFIDICRKDAPHYAATKTFLAIKNSCRELNHLWDNGDGSAVSYGADE